MTADDHLAAKIAAAAEGDLDAWRAVMDVHVPRLAGYLGARLRRADIVDRLVEEAVYAAWRKVEEAPRGAGFAAWFRRIGAGLALRWHRRHKHERLTGDFPVERCESDPDPEATAAVMERIEDSLGALPEKDRMALEQHFRAGLEGAELAEALHTTEVGAQEAVERALDHLSEHLLT